MCLVVGSEKKALRALAKLFSFCYTFKFLSFGRVFKKIKGVKE
ncbi:hypothetical protein BHECKSOX2_1156 [Bathymodiolus heckerae thiotrophic gill symbiont]|nr:hypothetical protein [uncultured Gammaproteobacteria bacterium]SMN13926.1 hypothetical protein BHECKSOX2_1156 [Bathymodiolus heckerae thiotrophic gill symbiont]